MPKIAIAEDHPLFRNGFALVCMQLGFEVILKACDGVDLQNQLLLCSCLPDIVFMDICMPNMCGKQATTFLAQTYPSIKVIALSLHDHEKHIFDMLNCGAKGYLSKTSNECEVIEAIHSVIKGEYYFCNETLKHLNIPVENIQKNKKLRSSLLNPKEYEFIKHCGSDDSYKQIADKMGIAYKTVDNYRNSVFKKLKVSSRSGLTIYAVLNGLSDIIDNYM